MSSVSTTVQVPGLTAKDGQPALAPEEQQKLLDSSELRPTDAEYALPPTDTVATGGRHGAASQSVLYDEEQGMLQELVSIYSNMEGGNGLQLHELLDIIHVRHSELCHAW